MSLTIENILVFDVWKHRVVFWYSTYVFNLYDMQATVIDPADMEGLEAAVNNNNVSSNEIYQLYFPSSPFNAIF